MVRVINSPRLIPAAGSPPKTIAEYIGREVSGTSPISIAMMKSPAGWGEPGQIPEFDEYSLVLQGTLIISTRTESISVQSGQVAITPAGEWVRYSSPEGAEYLAVCIPAFSPDLVHREGSDRSENKTGADPSELIFEEFDRSGLSLVEELWNQLRIYHASHARHFSDQLQARSFSERCQEILKTNDCREILVHLARVKIQGPYVGFCVTSAEVGDYGEIESIYVKPEYRSMGIGTVFLNRALSWMEQTGVSEYRVGVAEGNEQSFRFYERFGFYPRRHVLVRKMENQP